MKKDYWIAANRKLLLDIFQGANARNACRCEALLNTTEHWNCQDGTVGREPNLRVPTTKQGTCAAPPLWREQCLWISTRASTAYQVSPARCHRTVWGPLTRLRERLGKNEAYIHINWRVGILYYDSLPLFRVICTSELSVASFISGPFLGMLALENSIASPPALCATFFASFFFYKNLQHFIWLWQNVSDQTLQKKSKGYICRRREM